MLVSASVCFGLLTILSLFTVFVIVGAGMTVSRKCYACSWSLYEIAGDVIMLSLCGAFLSYTFAEVEPGKYSLVAMAAFMLHGYPALLHIWVKDWQRYAPRFEWRRNWSFVLKVPGFAVSVALFIFAVLQLPGRVLDAPLTAVLTSVGAGMTVFFLVQVSRSFRE